MDYRGIHITENCDKDTCILQVSPKCLITTDLAKASVIGSKILQSHYRVRSSHSYVAAFILQERAKPHSFWKPYLDILPKSYRHMPQCLDETALLWLKGSLCLPEIRARQASYALEYKNICSHVPEFSRFSEADFLWARLVVLTRIFGITVQGKKTSGLVPMADMLNHKRPPETYWTFDDKVLSPTYMYRYNSPFFFSSVPVLLIESCCAVPYYHIDVR